MRKNITLIIALLIPVIMVLFIIGSVYIPKMFVNPQYSFVYSSVDANYNYNYQVTTEKFVYEVKNGKVVKNILPVRYDYNNKPIAEYGPTEKLYFYDVIKNSTKEISLDEAQKYNLNTESRSPDGYALERNYGNYGIFELFGSNRENNGWYIKKGMGSKKLTFGNTNNLNYYSYDQIKFLGWVLK